MGMTNLMIPCSVRVCDLVSDIKGMCEKVLREIWWGNST